MRFLPKTRGSVLSRATGLLALSSAILSVQATNHGEDGCKKMHSFLKETKNNGDIPFSGKYAYDCLMSLPLDHKLASQTAHQLLGYHEMISTQAYLKNPPLKELELKPHDGVAAIHQIQEKLKKNEYKGLYEFGLDLYRVFNKYQDWHTNLFPNVIFPFIWAHEWSIVSVADDINGQPKIWTLTPDDSRKLHKEVEKINDMPAADYLNKIIMESDERFGFADPDARYNMLFSQFPTTNEDEAMGYFQFRAIHPPEETFKIQFKDGTNVQVEWKAVFHSPEVDMKASIDAETWAKSMWFSDKEYEDQVRKYTEEEMKSFEQEWGVDEKSVERHNEDKEPEKKPDGQKEKQGHKKNTHKNSNLRGSHRKTHPEANGRGNHHSPPRTGWKRDVAQYATAKARFMKRITTEPASSLSKSRLSRRSLKHPVMLTKRWKYSQVDEEDEDDDDWEEDDDWEDDDDWLDDDEKPEDEDDKPKDDKDKGNDNQNKDQPSTEGYPESFKSSKDGYLKWYDLDGQIAVLDITSFGSGSKEVANDYEDTLDWGLEYLKKNGKHKRLIIDLTNNIGGSFLAPFDFARTFFPKKPVFESVNQRYTKSNVVMMSFNNLSYFWDVNGKDFTSIEALLGPIRKHDDMFTNFYKYDHVELGKAELDLDWDPNAEQPFEADNIVVLANGVCGSSCHAFLESLYVHGVRQFVLGGRPNGKKHMQGSGGVKGGMVGFFEDYNRARQYLISRPETHSMGTILPEPIRLRTLIASVNYENQFRHGQENGYPLEFVYTPSCKRYPFTKDMMHSVKNIWELVKNQAWDKDGKKTGCDEWKGEGQGDKKEGGEHKEGSLKFKHEEVRGDGTPRGTVPKNSRPWRA